MMGQMKLAPRDEPRGCFNCMYARGSDLPKRHQPGRKYRAACGRPGNTGGVAAIWMHEPAPGAPYPECWRPKCAIKSV